MLLLSDYLAAAPGGWKIRSSGGAYKQCRRLVLAEYTICSQHNVRGRRSPKDHNVVGRTSDTEGRLQNTHAAPSNTPLPAISHTHAPLFGTNKIPLQINIRPSGSGLLHKTRPAIAPPRRVPAPRSCKGTATPALCGAGGPSLPGGGTRTCRRRIRAGTTGGTA